MYSLKNILFLDIETVAGQPSFDQLDPRMKDLWEKKMQNLNKEDEDIGDFYYKRSAIYAEFGKIVAISFGMFYKTGTGENAFKVKTYRNSNEKSLLNDFKVFLEKNFNPENLYLCAHNGKEFDFPYLCRRMLINDISLPSVLDISNKKPWEVNHIDTLELWKFGDRKNYTSLELLAAVFDIPTSKDDIDGSQITSVYYEEGDIDKIALYCSKDVIVTARVYLKMAGKGELMEENIFNDLKTD